jgi:hypothetical protein
MITEEKVNQICDSCVTQFNLFFSTCFINESNEKFFQFMDENIFKVRTTSEDIGQLKVKMIRVDENLSSESIKLSVHKNRFVSLLH